MNDEDKLDIAVSIGAAIAAPSPVTFAVTGWRVLRALLPSNTQKADAAFREEVDAMLLGRGPSRELLRLLHEQVVDPAAWAGEPKHMQPSPEDLVALVETFGRAYGRARSHGKRRMLFNAFFRSFDPRFYKDGMNKHLMEIAEKLEYPEARFLAGKLRDVKAMMEQNMNARPIVELDLGSRDYTLAKKLEALDLVAIHVPKPNDMKLRLVVFEIGDALMAFVWEDELGSDEYGGFETDPWTWKK